MNPEYETIIKDINHILTNIEDVISTHKYSEPNEAAISMIDLYCNQLYSHETYVAEKGADILSLSKKYYSSNKQKIIGQTAASFKARILNEISGIRVYIDAAKQHQKP